MAKIRKSSKAAPISKRKISVLSVFYVLLVLALGTLAGWVYWLDKSSPSSGNDVSVVADIATVTTIPDKRKPEITIEKEPEKRSAIEAEATASPESLPQTKEISPKEASTLQEKLSSEEPADKAPTAAAEAPIPAPASQKEKSTPRAEEPVSEATTVLIKKPKSNKETEQETTKAEPEQPTEPLASDNKSQEVSTPPLASKTTSEPAEVDTPEGTVTPTPQAAPEPPEPVSPLAPTPDPELAKKSDFGLLPIIGPSGRTPWRIYARPFDDPLERPRIAIVISEMGMSSSATQTAIQNLPGAVTLSFNPYARDLQRWIDQARAAGHEVLLQLPMEPFGYPVNDPGPNSLLTSLTDRENLNRLDWMLGRFTGYSGVTNQMGSRFTSSADDIQPILDVIKSRGLLFLDGRTSTKSVAGKLAGKLDIPVAINNRFLDRKADRVAIDTRLGELERIARVTGTAIGVGYPYPVTLERLATWVQTLNRKGFVLAPISAVTNRQEIQ